MERELINKYYSELNLDHLEYKQLNTFRGYFGNITLADLEKLKTLPFGVQVICLPENIAELPMVARND